MLATNSTPAITCGLFEGSTERSIQTILAGIMVRRLARAWPFSFKPTWMEITVPSETGMNAGSSMRSRKRRRRRPSPRPSPGVPGEGERRVAFPTLSDARIVAIIGPAMAYNFTAIEKKWQQYWLANNTFAAYEPLQAGDMPKKYI